MCYIRKILIAITLFIILVISAYSQDKTPFEKFKNGVDLFTAGNYQEALELWTDLYNSGYRSAELVYNIGNANFKLNNIPGAILFYERAHQLKPADENINYNLQIARTMVVDRFEEIPILFFVRWFNFLSLLLSSNSWAIISIISFIICLILISLYLFTSNYSLKIAGFWLALFLLIVSVSSLSFTIRNKNLIYNSKLAVIFSPQVSGKSSPDSSGTDLFLLHEGTKVSIEDKLGDWLEIRLSDGNKGWVPLNSLKII